MKLSKDQIAALLSKLYSPVNAHALADLVSIHRTPGALLCALLNIEPIEHIPNEALIGNVRYKVVQYNPLKEKEIRATTIADSTKVVRGFKQGDIDYVPEFIEVTLEEWKKGSSKIFNN